MTPEFIRDTLFRPFGTTKKSGYGIGAYQARELMRSAHGDLLVLSEAGQGTIMRIVLPVESPPASALPLNEPKVVGMTS